MNVYTTIRDLIDNINLLDPGEWIYTNIELWNENPNKAEFYYIPWDYIQNLDDDEIYLDEEEMEMPSSIKGLNLHCWMLVSSLRHIVNTVSITNELFIEEINYYRDYDTFKT